MIHTLFSALFVLLLLGCSDTPPKETPLATGATLQQLMQQTTHTVTIAEVLQSGGYTYIKAVANNTAFWVAGPQTDLKVGQTLHLNAQMWMDHFKSSSLGKTFESILFVQEFFPTTAVKAQSTVPPMEALPSIDGSITIKTLHEQAKTLHGTQATVHAKVIKISRGIMQKNWVHLQDGSSHSEEGTITATTTADTLSVGDIILATGTVTTNKDFGYGYFYPVILEETRFQPTK